MGASGGLHPRWRKLKEPYKAVLVEPDPREYSSLSSSLPKNFILVNNVLHDKKENINLNLCRKQMCSSVFDFNVERLEKYPHSQRFDVIEKKSFPADTLDNSLLDKVEYVDFIKIDAEGSELSILKGATNVLENAIGLEIETTFLDTKKGQPLFREVDGFVSSKNFQLIDIRCDFWKRNVTVKPNNKKGQVIFCDALYFREPECFFSAERVIDCKKLLRVLVVYLSYGYCDFAEVLIKLALDHKVITSEKHKELYRLIVKRSNPLLPEFKGKRVICFALYKLLGMFGKNWWGAGGGRQLGNSI